MEKLKHSLPEGPIDFSGIRVTIATPCYGGSLSHRYVESLAYTIPVLIANQIDYGVMMVPNDSIICTARNRLVDAFLKTEGTHIWFIDADMGWRPDQVLRLFGTKRPIVGGAGMRKQEGKSFCALLQNPMEVCSRTGMIKVIGVGTGCVVIAREVFEAIKEAEPDNWYEDNGNPGSKIYNFFEDKIEKNLRWTEDYVFCRKWRKLGGEIWVDPEFYLDHVGQRVWSGKMNEALKPMSEMFIADHLLDGGV